MSGMISRKLAKRWRQDWEDINQEVLLWCLSQGIDGSFADLEDKEEYETAVRRTSASMRWAGERYCRKEEAAKRGYSIEDEAFYSIRTIEELLAVYYQVGIEERPPITATDSVRHSKGDGSETGNYLVSMLDIQRALDLIPFHYGLRLKVRYGDLGHLSDDAVAGLTQSEAHDLTGWHHDRLTATLGTTGDMVRHRTRTALRALQGALGGASPWTASRRGSEAVSAA